MTGAAACRDEQQQRHADSGAAVGSGDQRVARISAPPVLFGALQVLLFQYPRHALVSLMQIRIDRERREVVLLGAG